MIHIENQWDENYYTIDGHILHERAHDSNTSYKRGDCIVSTDMPVVSYTLGITGKCDIVELHKDKNGVPLHGREGLHLPIPVEYKRGKPKPDDCDALQLCAQAMCLEQMFVCDIPDAYLYYGETRHRQKVELDEQLRETVLSHLKEMREMYERRHTPKVKTTKACASCSLKDICLPKLNKARPAKQYINEMLKVDV